MSTEKVFVIGLDGTTFEVIDPWIKSGELPTLQRLVTEGASGTCHSTVPPVSLPAWASFMTGKDPGGHGLFSFWKEGKKRQFLNSRCLGSAAMWDAAGEAGKKSIVINVAGTYPPRPIPGVLVTGMLTPSTQREYCYPADVKGLIETEVGDYWIDPEWGHPDFESDLEHVCHVAGRRAEAAQLLKTRYEWDLFIVVFTGTDRAQHRFLYQRDDDLRAYYRALDQHIGELIGDLDSDTHVVLMSDHGFAAARKKVYVNSWLERHGYQRTYSCPRDAEAASKSRWRRIFGKRKREILWEKTRAFYYAVDAHGVSLNVRGRELGGIVEPGDEYETLRAEIIAGLREIRDPDTGKCPFSQVLPKEELYPGGPYMDSVPDIMLVRGSEEYLLRRNLHKRSNFRWYDTVRSWHSARGFVIVAGPGAAAGKEMEGNLIDLAPTILHLLGVPVPEDMHGKVLTGALTPEFVAEHPVRSGPPTRPPELPEACDDEADSEEVQQRLRGLGYLD